MASWIWLGGMFGEQRVCKARKEQSLWNLEQDLRIESEHAIIAKGNIIEGIAAME